MNIYPGIKNVTATANMSPYKMKSLNITAGSWIEIKDITSKIYFCRVWPADIPANYIISINVINPINAIQVTIEVSVKKNITLEQQLADIGFVFD
ncbi:unnamed protein product [Cunninghamella echinulata]